jgi:hypothetical protein
LFTSGGKVLFYRACGKSVVAQQRSQVTQHLSGSKHIDAIARLKQNDRPGKKSLIGESSATSSSSGLFELRGKFFGKSYGYVNARSLATSCVGLFSKEYILISIMGMKLN